MTEPGLLYDENHHVRSELEGLTDLVQVPASDTDDLIRLAQPRWIQNHQVYWGYR